MRVLAIDPAIRNTGYAILEGDFKNITPLDYGVLTLKPKVAQSLCLLTIKQHLCALIDKWKPDEIAIESIIYVQSLKTAIIMGSARAAAIIAAGEFALPIIEYSPKSIKLAVVGNGNAQKDQVAYMVRALLGLRETPPHDAADALALAYAHISSSDPLKSRLLAKKYI